MFFMGLGWLSGLGSLLVGFFVGVLVLACGGGCSGGACGVRCGVISGGLFGERWSGVWGGVVLGCVVASWCWLVVGGMVGGLCVVWFGWGCVVSTFVRLECGGE